MRKALKWKKLQLIEDVHPAVTYAASQHQGRLFWIVCKRPSFLSSFSRLQLIQNSAPSVAGMRQCDIRMQLAAYIAKFTAIRLVLLVV